MVHRLFSLKSAVSFRVSRLYDVLWLPNGFEFMSRFEYSAGCLLFMIPTSIKGSYAEFVSITVYVIGVGVYIKVADKDKW